MTFAVTQLELDLMDRMKRDELLAAIRGRAEHLPADLIAGMEAMPDEYLRLLLLTGRLVHLLRQLRGRN